MKKVFKQLEVAPYPFPVRFCSGFSRKQCYSKLKKINERYAEELDTVNFLTCEGDAFYITFSNHYSLLFIDEADTCNYAIVAHEVFHAVYYIMNESGVKLSEDSEEAFAYLTEYLMKQIVEHLK